MSVVIVSRNLMISAPILAAAIRHGHLVDVADNPGLLVEDRPHLVVVDWEDREPTWGATIRNWLNRVEAMPPRVILFGPHLDRIAHAEARRYGLGRVWPRSRMVAEVEALLASISSTR